MTLDANKASPGWRVEHWLKNARMEAAMSPATILIALLIVCFFAVLPTWPHAAHWGYYPKPAGRGADSRRDAAGRNELKAGYSMLMTV